jgi:hypothetical protein
MAAEIENVPEVSYCIDSSLTFSHNTFGYRSHMVR